MNTSEKFFANVLNEQGKLYFFEPKKFKLPPPYHSYMPDFYVVEDNMFYEIAGTRQAYSYGREKYELFQKIYPELNFKIINPDGTVYRCRAPRVGNVKPSHLRRLIPLPFQKLLDRDDLSCNQKKVIDFLIEQEMNMTQLSIKYGISNPYITRYLNGYCEDDPDWLKLLPIQFDLFKIKKRITYKDIAKKALCSVPTVHTYFKKKGRLKESTREKITEALNQMEVGNEAQV